MENNLLENFKDLLISDVLKDENFKEKLLENPRAAIEEKYGIKIPEEIEIVVLKDTAEKVHIVLPALGNDELTEEELTQIAGGQNYSGSLPKGSIFDAIASLFKSSSDASGGYKAGSPPSQPIDPAWITKGD